MEGPRSPWQLPGHEAVHPRAVLKTLKIHYLSLYFEGLEVPWGWKPLGGVLEGLGGLWGSTWGPCGITLRENGVLWGPLEITLG